jgi:hypothetical protein
MRTTKISILLALCLTFCHSASLFDLWLSKTKSQLNKLIDSMKADEYEALIEFKDLDISFADASHRFVAANAEFVQLEFSTSIKGVVGIHLLLEEPVFSDSAKLVVSSYTPKQQPLAVEFDTSDFQHYFCSNPLPTLPHCTFRFNARNELSWDLLYSSNCHRVLGDQIAVFGNRFVLTFSKTTELPVNAVLKSIRLLTRKPRNAAQ